MGVDHPAAPESADNTIVSREGPRLERPKRVEWPDLLDQTDPEDVKTPRGVVKIAEVILCGLFVMHSILSDTHIFFF
jgi:hypothetical protein